MRSMLDAIWGFTESQGCKLWGVSTTSNPLFMAAQKTKVTVGVVKCTGQLMGYVNPPKESPDAVRLNVSVMEDLQRCFIYAQRGWKCARFNFLAVKTVNRATDGCNSAFKVREKRLPREDNEGNKTLWCPRAVEEETAAKALQTTFSSYVTIRQARSELTYFASEGGEFNFFGHGPTLRMKPKVAGTENKSLSSFGGHQRRLCRSCGITDSEAGDDEALVEESQHQEDECRDGEADQDSAQRDVSHRLLKLLTMPKLQQKIKELGLQKLEKSKGPMRKSDYVEVLIAHEMKQMAARCEKEIKEKNEAIESKRKAEQELASMQKKAGKDSQLAREQQEATRAIFKRQREEQESANAAAQAEIVKHEETFCIRYFV